MITKEILESHPVTFLKKEISESNIKGYSKKMKKHEIVSLMLKPEHSKRFNHIVKKGEAPKPEKKIVIKRTPKPEKKIVIKRTPKPEKKIVIKRTPKPTAPKPEKKIVIKKPRRETPGSIEAKRIKKKIAIKKEISETPEGYQNPDRLIGGWLKTMLTSGEENRKAAAKGIQIIKSGRYLSESKGVLSPNYTLEKYRGGSFLIISRMNKEIVEYLFDKDGELISSKTTYKEKGKAPAKKEKKYDFNFMKKIKFSKNSSENNRATENAIRKNFTKIEIKKMCDVLYKNKNSKEFYKMTKNLEGESYGELVESNILEICEE